MQNTFRLRDTYNSIDEVQALLRAAYTSAERPEHLSFLAMLSKGIDRLGLDFEITYVQRLRLRQLASGVIK